MNRVKLKQSHFLGKGGERNCYLHPFDDTKVIKILHSTSKHNNQNRLEYEYYTFLQNQNISFLKIPKCYGWIHTNYGQGLVFERIENFDKSKIRTFSFYAKHDLLNREEESILLADLKEYIFKNEILFVDASLSNVFCQKIALNKYTLIIFDGLGGRRPGVKFWFYLKSQLFRLYKIKKQWKKFEQNYEYEKSLEIPLKDKENIEY